MNTKMLIATLAASVALSFSASAATPAISALVPQAQMTPNEPAPAPAPKPAPTPKPAPAPTPKPSGPTQKPSGTKAQMLAEIDTTFFTAPKFCYVGKMKVACTLTDAPSKDPTGTRP
ncbi:hypothetical protein [Deinococcus hopiensis]|uniref:Uncharacterized protein n=1 Tax=Deinococcus hopiensis KR-140 TaxID=695939 RepID=A0A1W1UZF9_9DEIO|nr:hypothetical protein [Deinococcus hopiensis]SMB86131.1 hypothetical protein SAMN00790413_03698 [Deinococcus hopiensis KR-140]